MTKAWIIVVIFQKKSQKQMPTYHSLMHTKMIIWRWKSAPVTDVVSLYIPECIYSIVGLT